jgi:curved DNA-binding protein CbpA
MSAFEKHLFVLGPPETVPKPKPGLDVANLKLSGQEGFVLSRIDGSSSLAEICQICGLGDEETLTILSGLAKAGLIEIARPKARKRKRTATEQTRIRQKKATEDPDRATLEEMRAWAQFEFDRDALAADVDLSEVRRKRIQHLYKRLDEMTYYDLLGLDIKASEEDIRKAYYRLTKRFHPDRYFRRHIGPYREQLAAIFKMLSRSYDVLMSEESRRKYDLLHAHAFADAEQAGAEAQARKKRAMRVYEVAVSKYQAGVFDGALEDFREALDLDPGNLQYREMVRRALKASARERADEAFHRGIDAEAEGDILAAREAYVEAADALATPMHLQKASEALAGRGGNLDKALDYAKIAARMEPETLDILLTLADIHSQRGEKTHARDVLERASGIAPDDERVAGGLAGLAADDRDEE